MQRTSFLVFIVPVALTACGSDGGSTGGGPDTKLSDLTDSEKADFCTTNHDAFQNIASGTCVLAGLDAPTKAECDTARNECMMMTSGSVCDTAGMGPGDLSACTTVRVSVAQSCIEQVQSFFTSLTCDNAGMDTPTAPGCLGAIEEGCPELLGGG
jgi:hypothetical protein